MSSCFFNDTATTEIYTLSLHYALPISTKSLFPADLYIQPGDQPPIVRENLGELMCGFYKEVGIFAAEEPVRRVVDRIERDRKSTRLNSSHANISYAVFCLKKKKSHLLLSPKSFTPFVCKLRRRIEAPSLSTSADLSDPTAFSILVYLASLTFF